MQAGIYVRISLDREGNSLGVARQEKDCRAKAKAMGWTVAEVYEDNDVSASKSKPRPAYDRLMADLTSGKIQGLVVYDLDRLTRKPAELESFITLADSHGIQLANVSGDIDLATTSGRMFARIKGAVARAEADRIADRVKRQKQQMAENGRPFAGRYRVFGYTDDFQPHPTEAAEVVQAFERVASGEGVQAIARDWNERGIQTTAGNFWRRASVVGVLERAGYAGMSMWEGKNVGPTNYPALIDEALFNAVATAREGGGSKGFNSRKYLLSGIATCSECLSPMYGNNSSKGRYLCKADAGGCGKVTMKISWVDDAIASEVQRKAQGESSEPKKARDYSPDLEKIDARIEALRAAGSNGDIDLADLLPMLKEERAKRSALVKEAAEAVANTPFALFTGLNTWREASLSAQRVLIERYIKAVIIKPTTAIGRRQYDPNRLSILWNDGTQSIPSPGVIVDTL